MTLQASTQLAMPHCLESRRVQTKHRNPTDIEKSSQSLATATYGVYFNMPHIHRNVLAFLLGLWTVEPSPDEMSIFAFSQRYTKCYIQTNYIINVFFQRLYLKRLSSAKTMAQFHPTVTDKSVLHTLGKCAIG